MRKKEKREKQTKVFDNRFAFRFEREEQTKAQLM